MAKAMRLMEDNLKLCDAVVFVLDARAPASTYNPKLTELAGQRPVLFLFNKCDLADARADELLTLVRESGRKAIKLNATAQSVRPLQAAMEELVEEKAARLREKGSAKPLRFLIAGVPNTGKSTVINALSGSKKAQVGDKAGVTRGKQWVKCGSFELMDTPGTMPPALADQTLAKNIRRAWANGTGSRRERLRKCSGRSAKSGDFCSAAGNTTTSAANAPSSTISARAGSARSASTASRT